MRTRTAFRIACSAAIGVILLMTSAVALSDGEAFLATVLLGLWLATTSGVGALISVRRPDNGVGWILLGGATLISFGLFATEYALQGLVEEPGSLPFATTVAWLSSWTAVAGFLVFLFLLLTFPNGHLPSARWRIPARVAFGSSVLLVVSIAMRPGPIDGIVVIDNPVGLAGTSALLEVLETISTGPIALAGVGAVASQLSRLRSGPREQRQQIKWFAYAAGLVLFALMGNLLSNTLGELGSDLLGFWIPVMSFFSVPVAIGIAVLRYRLYDIDRIISRTLVYGALTAVLGAVYMGVVVALQTILGERVGTSPLVVAATTLGVAALFRPARARIQAGIDRRFNRRRYDAERTLEAFGDRLRDELDLADLSHDLVAVVSTTMQPAHVSLWLRGPEGRE